MKTSALDNDVSLVRIIWVDGSGQHRCRVSTLFRLYCGLGLAFSLFFKTSVVICFRSWNRSIEQVSELGENDRGYIYIFFH
jgi:hypothetical protein